MTLTNAVSSNETATRGRVAKEGGEEADRSRSSSVSKLALVFDFRYSYAAVPACATAFETSMRTQADLNLPRSVVARRPDPRACTASSTSLLTSSSS